jgi:hypothetical protein
MVEGDVPHILCTSNTRLRSAQIDITINIIKVAVKVKVKVKTSLCLTMHHAMKTYWGSGGIAPRKVTYNILMNRQTFVSNLHT